LAVRIRLARVGATKRPSYRVVAIDSRRPRDGRALEILGFYDPLTDPATVKIDSDRVKAWLAKGATPSETVVKLIRQAEGGTPPALAAAKARPTRKRAEKAAAPAAAPAAAVEPASAAAVAEAPAGEEPATGEAAPAETEEEA
jgi:small subunit ribosomal protein S16